MRRLIVPCACFAAAAAGVLLCGPGEGKKAAFVIGKDSLQIEQLRALVPESISDSLRMRVAGRRYLLKRSLPAGFTCDDTAVTKLSKRLSLISGAEYSGAASRLFLEAATALEIKMKACGDARTAAAAVGSLVGAGICTSGGKAVSCSPPAAEQERLGTLALSDKKTFVAFCSVFLGASEEIAQTVASFTADAGEGGIGNVTKMIKGLVADSGNKGRKKVRETVPESADNSVEALKFRPQQSIRDSIGKHLPNLQQMYKRCLKSNTLLSGVVWVTFRIGPDGRVISVKIKSSQIDNRLFLQRLTEYSRTIQFKPIPKTAGNMTFEFPFEFTAEE